MEKLERLEVLMHEVYNIEDVIDGAFNSEEFPDIPEVNTKYEEMLTKIREFNTLLNTHIK